MIAFDDFARVDMRVGRIVAAEPFPKARKPSYRLRIDFGAEIGERVSSAQLTATYPDPAALVLGAMGDDGEVWLLEPMPASPLGTRIG